MTSFGYADTSRRQTVLVYAPVQPVEVACGISSAVRAVVGSSLRDHYDIDLISTFRAQSNRTLPGRIAFGLWLTVKTAVRMIHSDAVLADIHAVSDRSLLSHAAIMFGARLAGRPAILRIHGGDFDRVFEKASGLHRLLIRFILRSATRVVLLSDSWRARVKAIEPRAVLDVIPNGVDCSLFEPSAQRPPRQCKTILFLANFCERKGHFEALAAIARLARHYPQAVLRLGGEDRDPGTRKLLEQEAARLGISHAVQFLGIVSGDTKLQALRDADVLILPSHTENMPVSIIEGMAAALPVVATAVGAVPEMIKDGQTGFVVRPRDANALAERLEQLFREPELARSLGRNGQSHARATWDSGVIATRTLALYELLCDRRSPATV